MKKEVFKNIPGYEGYYQISNLGNVKSVERTITRIDGFTRKVGEFIMTPTILGANGYTYPGYCFRKDNKSEFVKQVNALLQTFYPEYEIGTYKINYKDGNNTNVTLSNVTFDFWEGRYGGYVEVSEKGVHKPKMYRSIAQAGEILKFDHNELVDNYIAKKKSDRKIVAVFSKPFVYKKKTISRIS